MKKFFSLALWLAFLFPIPALSENMTNLTSGIYKEGSDLEAGIYSFSCDSAVDVYCVVATFADEKHYNQFTESESIVDGLKSNSVYYRTLRKDESCDIRIDRGYLLMVEYGEGSLLLKQSAKTEQTHKEGASSKAYEELLSALRSTELTSGEKLMARIDYRAKDVGMNAAIESVKASMLASGYTMSQTEEFLLKAQVGEELHPFHKADYDVYNMPAEDNGLENDTIFIDGVIQEYVAIGGKKDCVYGLIVEQKDGNRWLISCAEKIKGEFIGRRRGSDPEQHVFEGYDGRNVRIYGKYLGFSEKYKLPTINILMYGGMVLIDENVLIKTNTSNFYMDRDRLPRFDYLIGAEKCIESQERYWIE